MKEIENLSNKDPGYQRTRVLVPILLVAVIGLSVAYAWVSVGTTREMRVQSALDGNLTTARLSARLLDERPEDAGTLLKGLYIGDSTLYILDVAGRVVSMTGDSHNRLTGLNPDLPSYLARRYGHGILIAHSANGDRVLVGFAFADKPRWHVLVLRNEAAALNLTNYLFRRLSLLLIPLLALLLAAGWMLIRLFQRREQMARQLAAQNERLRAADHAKSDFLANMSHELRTPLANMQISLSGLLDPDLIWEKEQTQECLQLASEELDLLIARIRNLLDMSRIEAHARAIHKEPNDLTDIVGSALERLRSLLRGRPIRAEFPAEPLLAECDYAQIETVVINLVENAIKYSPAGTPIALNGRREENIVRLTVRNAGAGIAPEAQSRVFEKFYRASASPSIGGTGLGLTICKAVIEAHGGTIGVQNVPDGIEFWFSLPAVTVLSEVHA